MLYAPIEGTLIDFANSKDFKGVLASALHVCIDRLCSMNRCIKEVIEMLALVDIMVRKSDEIVKFFNKQARQSRQRQTGKKNSGRR